MVTFSQSFRTFLSEENEKGSVIARLIIRAVYLHEDYPVYSRVITTNEVNYITMRADGLLSYLPAGKEHKTNDRGEWSREGRQAGKAGKIIRKVFSEKMQRLIPNAAFEAFGNAYKAKFMDNGFRFELKDNTSIAYVYGMSIADGGSSLSGSCMNGDGVYMDIYKNCPHLKIFTLTNKDNRLCGRALVWSLNHSEHGDITFMDRIYVVEDYMYELFLNQAKERGWWRKYSYQTFSSKTQWINPTTDECVHMAVTVETPTDFSKYPYIDTMSFGCDGKLTNSENDPEYTYNNTDGTRTVADSDEHDDDQEDDHEDETYDELNDEWINNDYAVCISDLGERRSRGLWTHCDCCVEVKVSGRRTEWFKDGDDNYVEIQHNGRYSYYYIEHPDIVRLENGEFAHYDDVVTCETDGEYYLDGDDDLMQSEDGTYYHKENDDDVIYVYGSSDKDGQYCYLPDVKGSVFQEYFTKDWYWKSDVCFVKAELHIGYKCMIVYAFKSDVIAKRKGKRTILYHQKDIRIAKHYRIAA